MCVCMYVCVCVCDAFACKHDISRTVSVNNLIFGMWVGHVEMIPIVFGGGQRSFGVTRGQKVKTL